MVNIDIVKQNDITLWQIHDSTLKFEIKYKVQYNGCSIDLDNPVPARSLVILAMLTDKNRRLQSHVSLYKTD